MNKGSIAGCHTKKDKQLLKVKCHQGQTSLPRETFAEGNKSDFVKSSNMALRSFMIQSVNYITSP